MNLFSFFSQKSRKEEAKISFKMRFPESDAKIICANEAVIRLGLLKPAAIATIAALMEDEMVRHPKSICTAYRSELPQISDDEKRELGIRKNGFMSKVALTELSPQGLLRPLDAHEVTLLRATFSFRRYNHLSQADYFRGLVKESFVGFKYDVFGESCVGCKPLDGLIVHEDDAHVLAPLECSCQTANYALQPKIDWLA
jgi:hypothetical protein